MLEKLAMMQVQQQTFEASRAPHQRLLIAVVTIGSGLDVENAPTYCKYIVDDLGYTPPQKGLDQSLRYDQYMADCSWRTLYMTDYVTKLTTSNATFAL